MQSMYQWAQHIVRASARCFTSEDPDSHVFWETLVPRYCPSTVPALEARRENLAVALAGQLSVFFCRFLTGHWGSSGVGLMVFVVGNNARCSLQVSELTCYLALAGGAGALDVLDLLQHLVAGTIASQIAYGCYLSPSMLMESYDRMDPRQSQMMSLYAFPQMHPFHSMPPRPLVPGHDPMRTRMPPVEVGWGDQVASMIPGLRWQDVQAYMPFAQGSGHRAFQV
eukprot:CAMPEP_0114669364 /NCGR_PEP_ID=MMETSP0191-20121206/37935_1 /TAXON_ID=126664 /ORGANISM="Sorites sp." /LENGTH=224 /DNA_ID=CAMNT_0001924835 /DNA_START=44 /DNA_END=714 /DNA_ORIENTATION=+